MFPQELLQQADICLRHRQDRKLRELLLHTDPANVAQLIEDLPHGKRKIFALLPPELQAEIARFLDEPLLEVILPRLSDSTIARFIHFNDEDDAADILQALPKERQEGILPLLKEEKRKKIGTLLHFDPDTAGGLMDLNFIVVPIAQTLGQILQTLRQHKTAHKHTPIIIVTDKNGEIAGMIPPRHLLFSPPTTASARVVRPLRCIPQSMDREKILEIMSNTKTDVLCVTDDGGHILGIMHLRDLVRAAEEEATEDVYRFAGVDVEEELMDPVHVKILRRHKWLLINLGTAFLASTVVSMFEDTIAQMAILAAYMPLVAGMGGNAGTQTLAVVVRGVATGDVRSGGVPRVVTKEMLVCMANGTINGLIVFAAVSLLTKNVTVGAILAVSMILNFTIAGVFGSLVPITLKSFKIDPAIASSVFVTAATDIFGFLTFLGLATIALETL